MLVQLLPRPQSSPIKIKNHWKGDDWSRKHTSRSEIALCNLADGQNWNLSLYNSAILDLTRLGNEQQERFFCWNNKQIFRKKCNKLQNLHTDLGKSKNPENVLPYKSAILYDLKWRQFFYWQESPLSISINKQPVFYIETLDNQSKLSVSTRLFMNLQWLNRCIQIIVRYRLN